MGPPNARTERLRSPFALNRLRIGKGRPGLPGFRYSFIEDFA